MKIVITESALKQFRKINNPASDLIKKKIDSLGQVGLTCNEIKSLTGEFKGYYRLRVGDYRVIFEYEEDLITIVSILHRKDVYK